MATREEHFVVNPLQAFLLNPRRSGARWTIKDRPKHGTSATGWDLQAERKNQVLLIEAKYIVGPFAAAMAGLTLAPLTLKREKMKSRKRGSWCAAVAWAIGCNKRKDQLNEIYQILLDYFARNLTFWWSYSRELKVKYIFFVDQDQVARISFDKMLGVAERYAPMLESSHSEKRRLAAKLLSSLVFK